MNIYHKIALPNKCVSKVNPKHFCHELETVHSRNHEQAKNQHLHISLTKYTVHYTYRYMINTQRHLNRVFLMLLFLDQKRIYTYKKMISFSHGQKIKSCYYVRYIKEIFSSGISGWNHNPHIQKQKKIEMLTSSIHWISLLLETHSKWNKVSVFNSTGIYIYIYIYVASNYQKSSAHCGYIIIHRCF